MRCGPGKVLSGVHKPSALPSNPGRSSDNRSSKYLRPLRYTAGPSGADKNSMPYRAEIAMTSSMSGGSFGGNRLSSSKYFSKPAGTSMINILAGASPTMVKACGVWRGTWTVVPAPALKISAAQQSSAQNARL